MATTTDTQTVADEVQRALAVERQRERERTEAEQKKSERYKTEPSSYLRDQAKAAERARQLRIEKMYRDHEKKMAAEEKHAPELAAIASELASIDNTETAGLERVERDADQVRETADRERAAVKRKRSELTEQIEMDALGIEPGKRFFGFPRRSRGAK
jgi:hypothetical protein